MPIRQISVTFFFTVHLCYEYVQSNQSNTRDRKKNFATRANIYSMLFSFSPCSSLFLVYFVSSLLNKESMIRLIKPVVFFRCNYFTTQGNLIQCIKLPFNSVSNYLLFALFIKNKISWLRQAKAKPNYC